MFFLGNEIITPYVYSRFIDAISTVTPDTTLRELALFAVAMLFVHVFKNGSGQVGLWASRRAYPGSRKFLEDDTYSRLTQKSARFFANSFTGSIVTRFNRYSRAFQTIADELIFNLLPTVIRFVFPLGFMLFVAPKVAGVFAVYAAVLLFALVWLHRKKIVHSRAVATAESTKTAHLADTMGNILNVKTHSAAETECRTYGQLTTSWGQLARLNSFKGNHIRLFKTACWTITEFMTIIFVGQQAISGAVSVGNAVAIMLYVRQLGQSMWQFGKVVERIEQAAADATEMLEMLDEPIEVADVDSPKKLDVARGEIEFSDVHFSYEDGAGRVFTSLDLVIDAEQKIGLVGPSGGGKTTFVKLLLRFADVDSGEICIDGQNIADVAQDDLRRSIAYVPQEPVLFHRSIRDNITYGLSKVSKKQLDDVIKLSHVAEFVAELPEGLDTMVGERGVKLSGGQKQRIAIARAMLKPAPILLLDEATSALDSKSEKLIIDALDNLMKGRTTIVIAHRLSTIRKLDRILVLKKGVIAEDGSHDELVARQKGTYANLWNHQMGNFID